MDEQSPLSSNEPGKNPTMKDFNLILTIVIGISIVSGIGFITLILNYFETSHAAYENLSNQVVTQNSKIDTLVDIDTQLLLKQEGKDKIIYIPVPSK